MTVLHLANLTRGTLCPHLVGVSYGYSRIQSTACEQKRWSTVLAGLGPDAMMRLALGDRVVVHDVSERPRVTRACWQGVPWIRYALSRAWGAPIEPVWSRGGMNVTTYAAQCYAALTPSELGELRYFRQFYTGGPVQLGGCGYQPERAQVAECVGTRNLGEAWR